MNNEGYNEPEDKQVVEALRHFRESVHAWSEAEYSKARLAGRGSSVRQTERSTVWSIVSSPLLGWTMAAVVLGTTVGVPITVHHQHVVAAQKQEAFVRQQREAAKRAEQARAAAIDDDELMSHVDSDIAQDAPDAMESLSRLMNQSN